MRSLDWSQTDLGPPDGWPLSLKRYVAMVLEMPTPAIIFWGPRQTQLYNDGYAEIMGPRHPKYLGASFEACWPDTYPVAYPWVQKVLAGGVWQVENQRFVLTRHGFAEEAYFTFTFSPLRDDDGHIAGVFQPVVEVTDRVLGDRREELLRKLATRVDSADPRDAMAVLSEGALDVPMALSYIRDERAGELTLGAQVGLDSLDEDALRCAPIARIVQQTLESDMPQEVGDLEAALGCSHVGPWPEPTQRAHVLPLRRSASDATRGAVVLGVSPRLHFDAKYRDFLGAVARELASNLAAEQAKRLERRLLAREREARREAELQKEHLSALLTQAPTPMVVLRGPELVVELANPYACRLWMREPGDVLGRPVFEALPEIRDQVFQELLEEVYRSGETFVGREVPTRLARPDGGTEEVCLNFVYAPLRTPAGDVDGILVIAFDVTEQVRAREQVNELRAAAEAASRAKDQFFAVLGHELRNPLAPILTALQLMRMRGVDVVERERAVIERQANHLVRLVDDLLDVSRITRGKIELTKRPIELADAVTQAAEMALPLIEQRHHELAIDVPPAGFAVEADAVRLAQAISNLLTNAAKYTEPGGRIAVTAERREDEVRVKVRDTGIGIEPEMLPRVFDVFVQERQALDRSQGGLGLGLAIVRGIAELHGGSVWVESEGRGRGAEFGVRLPALSAVEQPPCERASADERHRPKSATCRSVLVVDDNEDAANTLAASLEAAGHDVCVAFDGPTALRMAQARRLDVALLDIGLPVMDGYELARRLRASPGLEGVVLVAVTGYGQHTDRSRSRAAGFDAHRVKPVDFRELEELVRSLGQD